MKRDSLHIRSAPLTPPTPPPGFPAPARCAPAARPNPVASPIGGSSTGGRQHARRSSRPGCRSLSFPLQSHAKAEIRWVAPSYTAIHNVLTNPVYAGAYAYGKSRRERYFDEDGTLKQRMCRLPRTEL